MREERMMNGWLKQNPHVSLEKLNEPTIADKTHPMAINTMQRLVRYFGIRLHPGKNGSQMPLIGFLRFNPLDLAS